MAFCPVRGILRIKAKKTALWQLTVAWGRTLAWAFEEREKEMDDEAFDRYAEEMRRTFQWRLAQFTQLGFAYPESVVLAGTGIDLGEARKLVTLGCPLETASRILL
jgi:hypothetical protein